MKPTRLAIIALALLCVGCTTAGPFVTSISSDGRGGLIVEKSMVKFNSFMGTISNENTTTTSIRVVDLDSLRRSTSSGVSQPLKVFTGRTD